MQKANESLSAGLILIFLFFLPNFVKAQYFAVGQDPASIKWRQIQTDHFQIIYPSDYESEGQRVAHIFEKVYNYSGVTLHHFPNKISVLLHTKSLQSNGFVAWSPSRVELFPTPNQEIYAQDWIEQLAIHELRHHVQIDKIESELPAIFKILLGEQAVSIVIGAYLPFWFLEGDAVVSETALSHSGRGRLSSFSMELKAQADEKGIYSLDKAYLGSYKDYIPDYYQLGYQIVSNIRNKNGGEVWSKVLDHIAKHPLGLNSLSKGLKLSSGKNQDQHYQEIMNNLKATQPFRFNTQEDNDNLGKVAVHPFRYYTSFRYPNFVNDSTFAALKTSMDDIPRIVLVDNKQNEKRLFSPGTILDESMSLSNGKIVWIESVPDLRWTHHDRTLLRILNIKDGNLWEKKYNEKLFAPAISPDGGWIAAVKFDVQNHCSIVLIKTDSGKIIRELKAFDHHTFLTPSWSSDKKYLYAIDLGNEGKSIIRINQADGEIISLTKPIFGEIKKPVQKNDYLYYSADYAGKNEGYSMELATKKVYRIAESKYGIKDLQISADGNCLLFADYTANGFKIARKVISGAKWSETDLKFRFQDTLSNKLSAQEKGIIDFSSLDSNRFISSKYVKIKNLFNIHSWSPVYIDPDQSVVNTGFSVISQNKLSTAITQFGYDYSTVNHTGKWIGKFAYTGWYPVWRISGDYGNENSSYYQINKHFSSRNVLIGQDTVLVPYTQKVMNIHLDIAVPLNLSHGKMYRMVEPEFQIGYSHYWQEQTTPSILFRGSYIPFTYRLYAYNLMQQSSRNIQTRWGQILDLQYRHTPLGDRRLGNIASAEGTLYLPGIFKNHGIKLYSGYQKKKSDDNYFNDLIYYPRGYVDQDNNQLFTFRGDYVLPVSSPDWNFGHLYYLKRVSLRIHYDFARISYPIYQTSSTINKSLSSAGAELLTECHLLRFIAPVKMGVRESFLIESKMISSEFIFSINLKEL